MTYRWFARIVLFIFSMQIVKSSNSTASNTENDFARSDSIRNSPVDQIIQSFSLSIIILNNFIVNGNLAPYFAISLGKILEYVKYVNISLDEAIPENLYQSFSAFPSFRVLSLELPEILKAAFPKFQNPIIFEVNKLHSSYFLNQWSLMTNFLMLGIFCMTFFLLEVISRSLKNPIFYRIAKKMKILTGQNLILFFFFNCFGDLTLFSILELQKVSFDFPNSAFSFLFCIIANLFAFFILLKFWQGAREIVKNRSERQDFTLVGQKKFDKKLWESFQIIYIGYRNDSLLQQSYFIIHIFRVVITYSIIGCFYDYPLFQSNAIFLISCYMLYYILKEKAIRDSFAFWVTVMFEILTISTNAFLVAYSVSNIAFNWEVGKILSYSILAFKLTADASSHLFGWIYFCLSMKNIYKKAKMKGQENIKKILLLIILENSDPSLDIKYKNPEQKKDFANGMKEDKDYFSSIDIRNNSEAEDGSQSTPNASQTSIDILYKTQKYFHETKGPFFEKNKEILNGLRSSKAYFQTNFRKSLLNPPTKFYPTIIEEPYLEDNNEQIYFESSQNSTKRTHNNLNMTAAASHQDIIKKEILEKTQLDQ